MRSLDTQAEGDLAPDVRVVCVIYRESFWSDRKVASNEARIQSSLESSQVCVPCIKKDARCL